MDAETKEKGLAKSLTPEMMRKLTRKVYQLWQRDLEMDGQKRRLRFKPTHGRRNRR